MPSAKRKDALQLPCIPGLASEKSCAVAPRAPGAGGQRAPQLVVRQYVARCRRIAVAPHRPPREVMLEHDNRCGVAAGLWLRRRRRRSRAQWPAENCQWIEQRGQREQGNNCDREPRGQIPQAKRHENIGMSRQRPDDAPVHKRPQAGWQEYEVPVPADETGATENEHCHVRHRGAEVAKDTLEPWRNQQQSDNNEQPSYGLGNANRERR